MKVNLAGTVASKYLTVWSAVDSWILLIDRHNCPIHKKLLLPIVAFLCRNGRRKTAQTGSQAWIKILSIIGEKMYQVRMIFFSILTKFDHAIVKRSRSTRSMALCYKDSNHGYNIDLFLHLLRISIL